MEGILNLDEEKKIYEYNIAKTENEDYLKIAAIYGANASGKTNILQAFSYI